MDVVPRVLEYLKTVKGVLDAYEMDDDTSKSVWDVERSVRTRIDSGYRNEGYDAAMEREHRVCVFYDNTYIFGKRSILKLMDSERTIMGTNVSPGEMEEFRARDDVIWVSDDFVVFPFVKGVGEETFVLLPFPMEEVEQNVPGVKDAIGTSPTTSSDRALKKRFGKPMINGLNTMIIAFD